MSRNSGRGIGDDDGGLAMSVREANAEGDRVPEPEYTSVGDFARYVGLMGMVVVVCVCMLAVEVVTEIKRLWNGEGTLWK